jgi:hypothetical protein
MTCEELVDNVQNRMKVSHVYQFVIHGSREMAGVRSRRSTGPFSSRSSRLSLATAR